MPFMANWSGCSPPSRCWRNRSELADALTLTQPLTSKHLRVLRDAGLVTVRVDGPRRWYGLRTEPLAELDEWLAPYRWMWESRLDRLGDHLDAMPDDAQGDGDAK
jgi:DNA-binding transcriptional ArsR family regulator